MQSITSLVQNKIKQQLKKHPDYLSSYVKTSIKVLQIATKSLSYFAEHLLQIQDIDLNTSPGDKERAFLHTAIQESFSKRKFHKNEYDKDFTWKSRILAKVNEAYKNNTITKQKFEKLTDISHLESPLPVPPITPNDRKYSEEDLMQELDSFYGETSLLPEKITKMVSRAKDKEDQNKGLYTKDMSDMYGEFPTKPNFHKVQHIKNLIESIKKDDRLSRTDVITKIVPALKATKVTKVVRRG